METASIISEWPGTQALADDLGVNVETVRQWRKRNSIPARYWLPMCEAAVRRKINGVSLERFALIASEAAA